MLIYRHLRNKVLKRAINTFFYFYFNWTRQSFYNVIIVFLILQHAGVGEIKRKRNVLIDLCSDIEETCIS